MAPINRKLHLITAVVQHRLGNGVIAAALQAGATGATYFHGQGTGIRQQLGPEGSEIEIDKRVISIIVDPARTDVVLKAVVDAGGLDKRGQGVAYVQEVIKAVGFPPVK